MSCKDSFSLFGLDEISPQLPMIPINDEQMSIAIQQPQITPETNFDILLNKHLNNHEITDVQLQQLPENQRNALVQIQSKGKDKKKRPDECQKLFYKRAFKYSQHKFFKRCKNRSRKMSHFYHYHFDTVSANEGIPITQFYHPNKKTKPGLATGQKTFNAKYVKLLLKSKTFLEDIKQYHKMFIDECLRERKTKLASFTNSLQRIMQRANEDSRVLLKYLQSSQCKIPWTIQQINETWGYAQRDLEDHFEPDQQMQKTHHGQVQVSLGQDIEPYQMFE